MYKAMKPILSTVLNSNDFFPRTNLFYTNTFFYCIPMNIFDTNIVNSCGLVLCPVNGLPPNITSTADLDEWNSRHFETESKLKILAVSIISKSMVLSMRKLLTNSHSIQPFKRAQTPLAFILSTDFTFNKELKIIKSPITHVLIPILDIGYYHYK